MYSHSEKRQFLGQNAFHMSLIMEEKRQLAKEDLTGIFSKHRNGYTRIGFSREFIHRTMGVINTHITQNYDIPRYEAKSNGL